MKTILQDALQSAVDQLQQDGVLPAIDSLSIQIDHTKDKKFGDLATNIALTLAKPAKTNPRELAQKIVDALPATNAIKKTEIAGPGFINFWLNDDAFQEVVSKILNDEANFGFTNIGQGERIHLEFVSANPTGPLHIGHGRGAAYGACLATILKSVGYQVHSEYYVNDAGRQMHILALSIWLRYCQQLGMDIIFPEKAYQGDYVIDIAKALIEQNGEKFVADQTQLTNAYPKDLNAKEEADRNLDKLISAMSDFIGPDQVKTILRFGLDSILADIKDDLSEFGVVFDNWFYESQLVDTGLLEEGINLLKSHGYTYEQQGAIWFRAMELGDEKDRVLVRSNGQTTYFASDVAYHLHKYNDGYDHVIDIFGSDHHGYIPRIRSYLKGLGKDPAKLRVLMVQFAALYRGGEKVAMSTRSGEFVSLRSLRDEVGNDATRFFYVMRRPEQHLDFDLDLATSQSNENPVYYIQYAHARICSVWRQLEQSDWSLDQAEGLTNLEQLRSDYEKNLMSHIAKLPEIVTNAAKNYEPHLICHYLQDCANHFHSYYNASKFLVEESNLRNARLCLIKAVQIVIAKGLKLLGLSAPQSM